MTGLTLRHHDGVAIIELDNPPQNRMTLQTVNLLDAAITEIGASGARIVLLRGAGTDFSYGADISSWPEKTPAEFRDMWETYLTTFNRFEQLPIPTVAAVTGTCTGGAFELALRADILLASSSARFGHTEESLGLITILGGAIRTAERAGRAFAADVAFTSTVFDAQTALARGIVSRVIAGDDFDHDVQDLVQHLATGPTVSYGVFKAILRLAATSGIAATEQVILDLSMPALTSADAKRAVASAVKAIATGAPRPALVFDGK